MGGWLGAGVAKPRAKLEDGVRLSRFKRKVDRRVRASVGPCKHTRIWDVQRHSNRTRSDVLLALVLRHVAFLRLMGSSHHAASVTTIFDDEDVTTQSSFDTHHVRTTMHYRSTLYLWLAMA